MGKDVEEEQTVGWGMFKFPFKTGRLVEACLPLFMEMDMTTALHGPVWILGMHSLQRRAGRPSVESRQGGARYSDVDADGQPPPHEEAPALQAVGDVFQEPHASHVGPAYGPHGSEGAPSPRAAFVTWQPPSSTLVSFPDVTVSD